MLRRFFCICLFMVLPVVLATMLPSPALAAAIDPYLSRYLHLTGPITLQLNEQSESSFSLEDLSRGKQLFEDNCMNCHVGGATLPNPQVSLSLTKLKGANPPRDNVNNLVAYFRQPMTYSGSEESYWCRKVPESWMSQEQVESLAAFVLTAAQKAPGWATETF